MRLNRLISAAVAGSLLGVVPVAMATSANAAVTVPTTTVFTTTQTEYTVGETIFFDAAVTTADPSNQYAPGTATLWMLAPGSSAWAPVATDDSVSFLYFPDVTAVHNAQYKVTYAGGTDSGGDVFTASESAPIAVSVAPKVEIDKAKKRLTIKGKITPKDATKKVQVKIKKGKKWKNFRTVKARNGKFSVTLPPARRGKKLFFNIIVPASAKYAGYSEEWYTYSY